MKNKNMHFLLKLIAENPGITATEARHILAKRNGKGKDHYKWYFYGSDSSAPASKHAIQRVDRLNQVRMQPPCKDIDNYWRNDGLRGAGNLPIPGFTGKGWYLTSMGLDMLRTYNAKAGKECILCEDWGDLGWDGPRTIYCSCGIGRTERFIRMGTPST